MVLQEPRCLAKAQGLQLLQAERASDACCLFGSSLHAETHRLNGPILYYSVFSAITKPFQEFQEAQMRPRQPSKREEAASRRNAIAAGQGNKFDQLLDIIKKQYPQTLPYLGPRAKPREKATEVCWNLAMHVV